jgi:hypothetical protein
MNALQRLLGRKQFQLQLQLQLLKKIRDFYLPVAKVPPAGYDVSIL